MPENDPSQLEYVASWKMNSGISRVARASARPGARVTTAPIRSDVTRASPITARRLSSELKPYFVSSTPTPYAPRPMKTDWLKASWRL